MSGNKNTGNLGEEKAAAFLEAKGFLVIERNWRHRHWEVDIIAGRNGRLYFFEVKTRTSHAYGAPEESMSYRKMQNLRNAAEEYQYQHPEWKYVQFDVLAITLPPGGQEEIFYIEDVYF